MDETPPDTAEAAPPSLELLEFLGEWQDGSGHFVDPRHLGLEDPAPETPAKDARRRPEGDHDH